MKKRQRVLSMLAGSLFAVSLCGAITASARYDYKPTLEECFSSNVTYSDVGIGNKYCVDRKKTVIAKTTGYSGYHYVRAYLGGSFSDPSGAVADSGRKYSTRDVTASASQEATYG